jgi:hypothetical protein
MFNKLFNGKKNAYFLELDESKESQNGQAAEAKQEAPAKPVEEKKAKSKQTKATSNGKSAKVEPAPTPKVAAPALSSTEALIQAAVSKRSSNGKVDPKNVQFAANDPMIPTMSRRRPGPSLNMFKDMARQAKTPRRG